MAYRVPTFAVVDQIVEDKAVVVSKFREETSSISIWDLSLSHIRNIGRFSRTRLWHLDTAEDILVIIEISLEDPENQVLDMRQTKCTTRTRPFLEKKTISIPVPTDCQTKTKLSVNDLACRTYGYKTVTQISFEKDDSVKIHLEYDHAIDQVSVRWIRAVGSFGKEVIRESSLHLTPYLVYNWIVRTAQSVIYDAATGKATTNPNHSLDIRLVSPSNEPYEAEINSNNIFLEGFGDREVIGLAGEGGVELWFCNPNFVPGTLGITSG